MLGSTFKKLIAKNIFSKPISFFSAKKVKFVFVNKDNSETNVEADIGKSILEIAHENNVDLEGACESSLACSTCHVYLDPKVLILFFSVFSRKFFIFMLNSLKII